MSPQKIIANKLKNANQTVVKNFNKVATVLYQVYKHLREPTDNAPMTTINQGVIVDLINTLSTQITSPEQIKDTHQSTNLALATQLVCHMSLLLQPRVRRLKQIFLYGTPGCGKSSILNLIKSIVGNRAFTPGAEASTAFALCGFIGHNTDVMVMDEMDAKTVQQFSPAQLNGILEGYLDTQVSKKHQVNPSNTYYTIKACINYMLHIQAQSTSLLQWRGHAVLAGNIPIDGLTSKMELPYLRTAEWMDRLEVYGVSYPIPGVPKIASMRATTTQNKQRKVYELHPVVWYSQWEYS